MAPIKKKVVAEPTSKTARSSLAKRTKEEPFKASGDIDRIIPLCGGEFAYVLDPRNGLTHHVKVGTERWDTLMNDLRTDPAHAMRIQAELEKLGWI